MTLFKNIKLPVIWVLLAFLYLADVYAANHKHSDNDNRFGSHGMALLSDGANLYVSHMPLYRKPHDYQIVYQIEVDAPMQQLLLETQQELLSVLPDNFDLDRLINGERLAINADVYQGHFERGGKLWLDDISVKFARRIFIRGLQEKNLKTAASDPEFKQVRLNDNRLLVVRHITKAPSVDQLLIVAPKSPNSADGHCDLATKPLSVLMLAMDLQNNLSANVADISVRNQLSGCFDVMSHYWETADFAK